MISTRSRLRKTEENGSQTMGFGADRSNLNQCVWVLLNEDPHDVKQVKRVVRDCVSDIHPRVVVEEGRFVPPVGDERVLSPKPWDTDDGVGLAGSWFDKLHHMCESSSFEPQERNQDLTREVVWAETSKSR